MTAQLTLSYETIVGLVEQLPLDEQRDLFSRLAHKSVIWKRPALLDLSPEERIQRLNSAFDALADGLTLEELAIMTEAMNAEYIEPFDEATWRD